MYLIITFVYCEGDDNAIQEVLPVSTTTSAPSTSSSPSSIPTQEVNVSDGKTENPCSSYRCGDYSSAKILTNHINHFFRHNDEDGNDIFNNTNWTAVFEVKERSPFRFLKAGVSCAKDSKNRMIFDNDFIERNNPSDMVWDVINTSASTSTSTSTSSTAGTNDDLTYNNFNFTDFANKYNISTNNFTMEGGIQSNINGDDSSTTKKRNREKSFKIPSNIHINIYAINDQLEFRYNSCPQNMITPVIDIITPFEINNKTYGGVNTTNLRFVWNKQQIITGAPKYWESFYSEDPLNDGMMNVTLELWVPKWILETTTIICPRIDYTLGIEIGGSVDSGDGDYNNSNNEKAAATTTANNTNDTNIEEEGDLPLLLTHGPPRSLTVLNFGIGTELVIDINTSTSTNTTTNNNTNNTSTTSGSGSNSDSSSNKSTNNSSINMLELLYIDQTLNSEVRIQTDDNVNGTILMVGSNMQAAIVLTEDSQLSNDDEKRDDGNGNEDGDDISIILNGFQQVVTVMGKYEEIVLGGNSIALYTTEGCSAADRVTRPGVFTACFEIDTTNISSYYSDELKVEISTITVDDLATITESDGSLYIFQDSVTYINFTNVNVTSANTNRRINNPTPGGLKPLSPVVVLPTCLVATTIIEFNCNPLSSGSSVSTTSITYSNKNKMWSYIATSIVIATTIINN
jgi:hypothetical protein